jgi:NAD(P)-dependent dehydrogenase (short-subunit alcohol dehydrogenase family)
MDDGEGKEKPSKVIQLQPINQREKRLKIKKLLEGRVAVVTGAGSGIGRAEAIYMAQKGAKVVVNDIGTNTYGNELSHEPADAVVRQINSAGNIALANYDSVAVEKGAKTSFRLLLITSDG